MPAPVAPGKKMAAARAKSTQTPLIAPGINNPVTTGCVGIHIAPYSCSNPFSKADISQVNKHIYLPMPIAGLENTFQMGWEQKELGFVGAIGSDIADSASWKDVVFGTQMDPRIANLAATKALDAISLVPGIAGEVAAATSIKRGVAANPNLALLFNGVKIRSHKFTWRLTAANSADSKTIKDIIYSLQKSGVPQRYQGENYNLGYPDIVSVLTVGPLYNPLVLVSQMGCVIGAIHANYQGSTHAAFFKGTNDPVEVLLSIEFIERGILTSDEF